MNDRQADGRWMDDGRTVHERTIGQTDRQPCWDHGSMYAEGQIDTRLQITNACMKNIIMKPVSHQQTHGDCRPADGTNGDDRGQTWSGYSLTYVRINQPTDARCTGKKNVYMLSQVIECRKRVTSRERRNNCLKLEHDYTEQLLLWF